MNQSSSNENENDDPFAKVAEEVMQHAFGFTHHPFQQEVMPYLIKMKNILLSYYANS